MTQFTTYCSKDKIKARFDDPVNNEAYVVRSRRYKLGSETIEYKIVAKRDGIIKEYTTCDFSEMMGLFSDILMKGGQGENVFDPIRKRMDGSTTHDD